MQGLQTDVAFLRDVRHVGCRVDVPFRTIIVDILDLEMQVFARGAGAGVSRHTELLAGLHRVAFLHGDAVQVHISDLQPSAAFPCVLDGDGLSSGGLGIVVYADHFPVRLSGQHVVMIRADVDALVHLLPGFVHRVGTHPERRGDEQVLLPSDRE